MSSAKYNVESSRSFLDTHSGPGAVSVERIQEPVAIALAYFIALNTLEHLETKYTLTPKETV